MPYLMSSHPGSTLDEAIELAEYVRDMGFNPEQVQDFYPTPSTMSTAMYFTAWTRAPWSAFSCRKTRMRRRCSARSFSIATRRTMTW